MNFRKYTFILASSWLLLSCQEEKKDSFSDLLNDSPSIKGNETYKSSPFVTAGDRVYLVGHQDGSFPEIGWHIKGEMGGIWNHPIKLMDGFNASIQVNGKILPLDKADTFINYPFANKHVFKFNVEGLEVERIQFVPDGKEGVFIQFVVKNTDSETKEIEFKLTGHSDLSPTWLGERSNMIDGKDKAKLLENKTWVVKDSLNPWFTVFGSDILANSTKKESYTYQGKGVANSLTYQKQIEANSNSEFNFVVAGSYKTEEESITTYNDILSNHKTYLEQKKNRYQQLSNQTKLTIPDKTMQQTFEWLKYNSDWLIRTVPEIGSGITAGIPDYPWWFGVDSEYALQGYMAIGQEDAVYNTIKILDSVSNAVNGNGKIIHEMSTNGVVFNPGNINETPQFASLIWYIYQWNGDKGFLEKYFPTVEKGLQWLMDENDMDSNLFPEGFGMMEIHGLDSEMIDVAAYTQKAFLDASKMAKVLGKVELSKNYETTAEDLKKKINQQFWSEEFNSYADFIGTDKQAVHLIEDAIRRANKLNKPWAVKELEVTKQQILKNPSKKPRPFVVHHNWVVNTPTEVGIADTDKAIKSLNTAAKFVNPFGVFVTGIDRDESAGTDDGSFAGTKAFSYVGAVMTLPTGVQVISENNYGRPNKALDYLKRMTRSFSYALPGSMYEVSPDYGMIAQAWNIYSFAVPIVNQFFGVLPDAANKTITINPLMPDEWNEASLESVKISGNNLSIDYTKNDGIETIEINQTNESWSIQIPKEKYTIEIKEGNVISETKTEYMVSGNKIIYKRIN